MIDRYLLRYFLAVIDEGGFSRAARQCRVTQPTLSVGIAKLERVLGRKLLDRSNRRVALTPAGSRFAEHARRIEAEFAAAERTMREDAGPRRTLRIGLLSTLPPAWVERAMRAALAAAGSGDLRLEIVEARARELGGLLDRGRVDATIGPVADAARGRKIFHAEDYLLAMPASHPLARRREVDPAELAGEAMLVRRHCEALPDISRFFTGHGVRPFMAARTISDPMAIACVRAGLAMTVMPASFACDGVAMLRLTGFALRRTIGATAHPDRGWTLDPASPVMAFGRALGDAGARLDPA